MTGDDDGWSRLAGRDNALNALRLGLAALVVLSHSWGMALGQAGPLPYLGGFAVDGFFVISGFLVTGSRLRLPLGDYLRRRALRILPGLWACLLVSAFVLAPVAAVMSGQSFDPGRAAGYVLGNASTVVTQPGIGLRALEPVDVTWNAPLWTLAYECAAYVIAGLLLTLPWFRARAVAVVLVLCSTVTLVWGEDNWTGGAGPLWARLGAFFAAGMLLRLWRPRVSGAWAMSATMLVAALMVTSNRAYTAGAPLALAFALLYVGARAHVRLGVRNDLSYGLYIYGWPVQLLLLYAGVPTLGPWWFAGLSLAATLPLAWASWLLVERPALRAVTRRRVRAMQRV